MKSFGIIYLLINKVNKKTYVGQSIPGFNSRMQGHKSASNLKNPKCLIDKKIKEYGWDNFEKYHIDTCYTNQDDLTAMESYYIDFYSSNIIHNMGYNIREAGNRGKPSLKSLEKMSKWQIGLNIGDKNPFFGKKHTAETKKRISDFRKSMPSYKISEKGRENISKAKMGSLNPNFGKKSSKETTLKKQDASKRFEVYCFENGKIYKSQNAAVRELNLYDGALSRFFTGKVKQVMGYTFKRLSKK